jgi:hypothetical protein
MQFNLGTTPRALLDGSASWNTAVAPVLDMWNQNLGKLQFSGSNGPTGFARSGDRLNSIAFAKTYFGNSFGKYTLAITYYLSSNSTLIEADVLFNEAMAFDSYRGPLRFPSGGGIAIADIRRVLLHELGAALGALALAPATPKEVKVETKELTNDTTLTWRANEEPDLAGYRVLWRETTADLWEQSAYARNVTRFTVQKISKDNYLFGVCAVDREGNVSPAVYPAPIR